MGAKARVRENVGRGAARDPGRARGSLGAGVEATAKAEGQAEGEGRIVVFDIETTRWDEFYSGAVLTEEGTYEEHSDPEALFDAIWREGAVKGTDVYAWNGGRFDFLWAAQVGRARGLKAKVGLAAGRVTSLRWTRGPVFRDACALIPLSLEKASPIGGIAAPKRTGLPCICPPEERVWDQPCGGYCSIGPGMTHAQKRSLSRYLREDNERALKIIRAIRVEAKASGYELRGTIGMTAWATAQAWSGIPDADWTWTEYKLARSGYYGGRAECFMPRAERGWSWDIVSAYPDALTRTPLPVGERIVIHGARAKRAFSRRREGIYEATCIVPEMHIPPLPYRVADDGSERVIYPIGEVSGAWTRIELQYAISLGVKVTRWGRAIVWQDAEPVLAPFAKRVWDRRDLAIAEGNSGLKEWHKLVDNSLTGKLAQKPEVEDVTLNLDPADRKHCPATGCLHESRRRCLENRDPWQCCSHRCTRKCGAHEEIGIGSKLYSQVRARLPECGHVHWAAYLTAATRIKWHEMAIADGDGGRSTVYGDTDSIYAIRPRPGGVAAALAKLGDWKEEGAWTGWTCDAPKSYLFQRDGKPVGPEGTVVKAKGLPGIDERAWRRFTGIGAGPSGEDIPAESVLRERGVMSLKSAARGRAIKADGKATGERTTSLFARKRIERQSRSDGEWFGGRRLGPDGLTHPTTVEDFHARARQTENLEARAEGGPDPAPGQRRKGDPGARALARGVRARAAGPETWLDRLIAGARGGGAGRAADPSARPRRRPAAGRKRRER